MNITILGDFLTGKSVQKYYTLYSKTQWYDQKEMEEYQLVKLKRLINHCYYHVPFYTDYMKANGILPSDIDSLNKLTLFPIITKEIIKNHYDKFIPTNLKEIKGVKTSQTGGTTGNILFKRNDANTRSSVWATYKRFNDWMGYKDRDKALILMGGHVIGHSFKDSFKKFINDFITNKTSFSPYDTSEENLNKIISSLKNNKYKLIRSYSQFLYSLGLRLKHDGLHFNIKSITTTAEALMAEHRVIFKEVFNAESFDQYGCGEIGGVAFECDHHNGLHIAEERVIVDVNDKNELIITDLDNYSMPFVRYWNADQAILSDTPCSCGRKSRLIKTIMGRTCDYIIGLNGEFLHWAYFWHLFFDSGIADKQNLKKFQIIQEAKDSIKIRIVSDPISAEQLELLTRNIQNRLGEIKVVYIMDDDIENTKTGKYRPVINKLI